MRFTLKLACVTAILFTLFSCSKSEIVEQNQGEVISFSPIVPVRTRAIEETTATLKSFDVTSIIKEDKNLYFSSNVVKQAGAKIQWKADGDYYMIPDKTLAFFAHANLTASQNYSLSISADEQVIANYSPATNVAEQKDVLVSYKEGKEVDFPSGTIAMNFKHILSQIEVQAYCANPLIKIEVVGVQIANVKNKADFVMPTEETTPDLSLASNWNNIGESIESYTTTFDKIALTEKFTSLKGNEGTFMLLPQQLTSWNQTKDDNGAYIAIKCRILSKSNVADKDWSNATQLFPAVEGEYAYTAIPMPKGQNWLPGKKYIYKLEFCNSDTGSGGGVDPENPESPILGNPIIFDDITVEEWTSGEEVDMSDNVKKN